MQEEIEKLLKEIREDIKQSKTDLECAFGDEAYECAVNSRLNCLMQYGSRIQNILNNYKRRD